MTGTIVSIVMLVLAIVSGWPYRYYQLLRVVVCGTALFLVLLARKQRKGNWVWTFTVVAVIFNPLVPMYLGRELWGLLDLIALVLFAVAMGKLDVKRWRTSMRR